MAESIIAYYPLSTESSGGASIYQYIKDEYSYSHNFTGSDDGTGGGASYGDVTITNFTIPANTALYRIRIDPFIIVCSNSSFSGDLSSSEFEMCFGGDNVDNSGDDYGRYVVRRNFTNNRASFSEILIERTPSSTASSSIHVYVSQEQEPKNYYSKFTCRSQSPIVVTFEAIYLDPQFPD